MAVALDEQIFDLAVTKLAGITTAGGFEQTVKSVRRPPDDLYDLAAADLPALIVRKKGKVSKRHIRLAEVLEFDIEVLCAVDGTAADVHEAVTDLISDVKKIFHTNRLWNDGSQDLAAGTELVEDRVHETEVVEEVASGVVVFRVMARADIADPFVKRDI